MDSWGTLSRLFCALITDGFVSPIVGDGWIGIPLREGVAKCEYAGPPSFWPHPRGLRGPIRLGKRELSDPVELWERVARDLPAAVVREVSRELANSVSNSTSHLSARPAWGAGLRAWEAVIVGGHATHPMHRTRMGWPAGVLRGLPDRSPRVPISFVSFPAERMVEYGDFRARLDGWMPPGAWPVHVEQVDRVLQLFPGAQRHELSRYGYAQTSLRTLELATAPWHLKLSLGVQTTSALRTISPNSVFNGPRLSAALAAAAPEMPACREVASFGVAHADPDVAKHFAGILRSRPEEVARHPVVPGAALEEWLADGPVVRALAPNPARFFVEYAELLFAHTLPAMQRGLALEAHGQNLLVQIDNGRVMGFVIRDFGGVRLHRESLARHGVHLSLYPDSAPDASSRQEVFEKLHHCVVQRHLDNLRVGLGLPDDAWRSVAALLPQFLSGDALAAWTAPTMAHKCLLRMRTAGLYRDYLTRPRPNPLARR